MQGHTVHGHLIRAIREEKLMTLKDLVRSSGVSYACLKTIQNQGHQPTAVIATAIANGLGVPISAITTADTEPAATR